MTMLEMYFLSYIFCYTPAMSDFHALLRDTIPDLPQGSWPLLGEGLWSTIHDLGDGSVLKLVRRNGGLGSGESKHYREAEVLRLLDGLTGRDFRVPRLLGAGRFADAYGFSGPPLAGWLRIEKLPGRALEEGGLYALKSDQRERIGETIGAALAAFHAAGAAHLPAAAKLGRSSLRSLDEALTRIGAPEQRAGIDRLKAMWAAEEGAPVLLHGDVNLANLVIERGAPIGLVDFAEAGTGLPEEDLRHFDNPGPLRDAIFRAYGAVAGRAVDMRRFRMAVAVNAAVSLALGSNAGHPREAMRRVSFLDEALRAAGAAA